MTLLPPRSNGKPEASTAVYKLLMMGKRMPEICWGVFKWRAKKSERLMHLVGWFVWILIYILYTSLFFFFVILSCGLWYRVVVKSSVLKLGFIQDRVLRNALFSDFRLCKIPKRAQTSFTPQLNSEIPQDRIFCRLEWCSSEWWSWENCRRILCLLRTVHV